MKLVAPIAVLLTGLLLAGCASSGAENAYAQAEPGAKQAAKKKKKQAANDRTWTMPGLFGTFYSITPRQTVPYKTGYGRGTIVVDTSDRYLYYVTGNNEAIRYNIAVGEEGYNWSGVSSVSAKREWPDWSPTPGILRRYPDLPRHMKGGPDNPLGARALYLGATLYRIHGTNEPWKLGSGVSSGCIRLSNEDIIDLYNRTRIGATVVVKR